MACRSATKSHSRRLRSSPVLASRRAADEAQANGIAAMRQAGLQVIDAIDRAAFVAAMAPATRKYDELFTPGLVGWVSNAS